MTDRGDPAPLPRRTFLAGALAALGAVAAACGGGHDGAKGATASAPTSRPTVARFVASGPADDPRVALTFHTDGDLDLARELLDELSARHVKMTSFVVGDWLDANPEMATRIADGGHEFANHTGTHPSFLQLSHDDQLGEIVRCRDVLIRLTGGPGVAFRPSGTDDGTVSPGDQVLSVAAEAGYGTLLGFDVDPFDYDDPGADAVVERTLAAVHPGAIISLHFGHPGTVAALPAILDGLDERHLTPATVTELLSLT